MPPRIATAASFDPPAGSHDPRILQLEGELPPLSPEPPGWRLSGALLRRLVREDAAELFAMVEANRERLRPWMEWEKSVKNVADVVGFLESAYALGAAGPTAYECGVFDVSSGALAGAVGLNSMDLDKRTSNLGYWVSGAFEGRGWITAATRALTRFGFETLELERIEIRAAEGNARSQAVAQRAGFTREGVLRSAMLVNGTRHDVAVFSCLPQDRI